ncbi:hypothetical protein O0L34_g12984 [Tuta absoluta]|nr:hypothetical protein O0L34_g12984 [Tuta absoluta]
MRPLSTYYDHQITAWLRSNPGMVVTVRQVAEIFGKAFIQASSMSTAVNGFKKCGIWPYDPTVFSESDFAPSLTTDIPQFATCSASVPLENSTNLNASSPEFQLRCQSVQSASENIPLTRTTSTSIPALLPSVELATSLNQSQSVNLPPTTSAVAFLFPSNEPEVERNASVTSPTIPLSAHIRTEPSPRFESTITDTPLTVAAITPTTPPADLGSPMPGCSHWLSPTEINNRCRTPQQTSFTVASPQEIMPLPATRKTTRVTKKRGKTAIITSSPYKNELEETIKKKKLAEEDRQKKKEIREVKKAEKTANKKRRVTKKKKVKIAKVSEENSDSDVENTPCLYCDGRYLESNEGWVACSACGKWAHCSCAGVEDEDEDSTFKCEFC